MQTGGDDMQRYQGKAYMTPQEYSKQTGISEGMVRKLCRQDRLEHVHAGNRILVLADAEPIDYEPKDKHGKYLGMAELRRGDLDGFMRKRGLI